MARANRGKTERAIEETPLWARGTTTSPGAVRTALGARRVLRGVGGPLFGVGTAAALAYFEGAHLVGEGSGLPAVVLSVIAIVRMVVCVLSRARSNRAAPIGEATEARAFDLEPALLLSACATTLAAALPQASGASYAIVLVAIGILGTFARPASAAFAAIAALAVEAGIGRVAHGFEPGRLALHALALSVVLVLNGVVLRGRIDAISSHARKRLDREIERMREQARSYRLDAPPPSAASSTTEALDPERTTRSGVEEIQIAVRFALDLLKRSLGAHTALLLFERPGSKSLRLVEVVSDAPAIVEGPFGVGDGVLGAVARRRAPVSLHGLRAGYRIPYYPQALGEGAHPTSVVAAPILDGGSVRGVVCVDRLPEKGLDRAFSAHEEELVAAAARYILRAIENERVFGRLERAKAEQDHLYAATQRLSHAITETEVLEAGVESARAIASFDLAAITIVHEGREGDEDAIGHRTHEVRAVAGVADFESLVGLRFGDNGGLVAQAVKARHSLPHRGDHDPATQVVFTRRHPLRTETTGENGVVEAHEVRSILVVPLMIRDRVLGTLVLGARRRGAFRDFSGEGARTTLEVLASHVATSLANARMFAKLEELATTDGLTGLLNKRVLLELGQQKVRAAARYGKPLAVIQTDIDHFKNVNDTHGHDVGDQVIKGLAGILRRLKRGTDYVARFGGEEFVLICEETDALGAMQLAERVREELGKTTFHGVTGPFQVTCSLGVATFPAHGSTWEQLYKATDEALYASKRGGRNRTSISKTPTMRAG